MHLNLWSVSFLDSTARIEAKGQGTNRIRYIHAQLNPAIRPLSEKCTVMVVLLSLASLFVPPNILTDREMTMQSNEEAKQTFP